MQSEKQKMLAGLPYRADDPELVRDHAAIRAWMDTHRGETAFVVLEHTRLNSFRTLVGARRLEVLTDERFNNKFVLVRVSL